MLLSTGTPGGYGYLNDFSLGRIYCDVRGCEVCEGRMDIQWLVISEKLNARDQSLPLMLGPDIAHDRCATASLLDHLMNAFRLHVISPLVPRHAKR